MDSETTINEMKEKVRKFSEDRDWDQFHGAKDLAIGISTESAELLEKFRFKTEEQIAEMLKNPKKREEMSDELADIMFFVLRFSQRFDLPLSEAFNNKLAKTDKKYPVEKIKGKNTKYTEI